MFYLLTFYSWSFILNLGIKKTVISVIETAVLFIVFSCIVSCSYLRTNGTSPYCTRFEFRVFSSLLTFRKIIEKCPVFKVSPVQVLSKRGWHLLFTSHSDFCKNAQKPHKNGTIQMASKLSTISGGSSGTRTPDQPVMSRLL